MTHICGSSERQASSRNVNKSVDEVDIKWKLNGGKRTMKRLLKERLIEFQMNNYCT